MELLDHSELYRAIAGLAGSLLRTGQSWQTLPLLSATDSALPRSPSQQFAALTDSSPAGNRALARELLQRVRSLFGAQAALLFHVPAGSSDLVLAAQENVAPALLEILERRQDPLEARARLLNAELPEVLDLREPTQSAWRRLLAEVGYRCVAVIPLPIKAGESKILYLLDQHNFTPEQREQLREPLLLTQRQLQVALEQRTTAWKMRRNARRLEAVERALRRLNAVHKPGETLQTSCDQVQDVFQGSAAWIGLYDYDEHDVAQGLTATVASSGQEALLKALDLDWQSSERFCAIYRESISRGGILQRDSSQEEVLRPEKLQEALQSSGHPLHRLVRSDKMRQTLVVPLWSNDHQVGVLVLHLPERAIMAREDYTVLRIFADQIGIELRTGDLIRDVRYRARMLEIRESIYKGFMQQITDGIFRLDQRGTFMEVSDFALELFGATRPQLLGSAWSQIVVDQDRSRAERALWEALGGASQEVTLNLKQPGDKTRVVVVRMGPLIQRQHVVGVIGVARDDTQRRALQSRLMTREKLASVGSLAEGIAHEINNPLSFIISNLNSLAEDLREPEEAIFDQEESLAMLQESLQGAMRIRDIVQRIRQFSQQRSDSAMYQESLNDLLNSALWMVHSETRYGAHIQTSLAEELPLVTCSPGHILQVLVHLLFNAVQSLRDKGPRVIRVSSHLATHGVTLEISDSGRGIPRERLARVTEPFYTDSQTDGAGLGLSICLEVIQDHGGQLQIDTSPDEGTTVRVLLPLHPDRGQAIVPSLLLRYQGRALDDTQQLTVDETS